MLLIKYENDVVLHNSLCLVSGMTTRDDTVWYQSLVSMLILDGTDKWYLDRGFEKKLCLEH
jgi:hypothetical protein